MIFSAINPEFYLRTYNIIRIVRIVRVKYRLEVVIFYESHHNDPLNPPIVSSLFRETTKIKTISPKI